MTQSCFCSLLVLRGKIAASVIISDSSRIQKLRGPFLPIRARRRFRGANARARTGALAGMGALVR